MRQCRARRYSDQMNCHDCGLVWDVNDPEPPECDILKQRDAKWPKCHACGEDLLLSNIHLGYCNVHCRDKGLNSYRAAKDGV